MGMEIYEILDIQRYNSNVFNIIEMNMVVRNKYTGIRQSFVGKETVFLPDIMAAAVGCILLIYAT